MDIEQRTRIMHRLRQISALSHDPDAAGLVDSATQLMTVLEPLRQQAVEAAMQQQGRIPEEFNWVMLLPMILQSLQQRERPSSQRPLSEQALHALPEILMDRRTMEHLRMTEGEAMCAICHEDYTIGQSVLKLPCEHFFCVDCGRQWLRQNGTCPFCRREVCSCDGEERVDDRNGWHTHDLFPRRYVRGSALAVVRRAREIQDDGAMELWPPVDDMSHIADEHPTLSGRPPSTRHSDAIHHMQPQNEDLEEHGIFGENIRPQGNALNILRRSRPSSRAHSLNNSVVLPVEQRENQALLAVDMSDRPTQGTVPAARNSRISTVIREQQSTNASVSSLRRNGREMRNSSRGQDQSLPALSPSSNTSASRTNLASRSVNVGARVAVHTRASGSNTWNLQTAQLRERRRSDNIQR